MHIATWFTRASDIIAIMARKMQTPRTSKRSKKEKKTPKNQPDENKDLPADEAQKTSRENVSALLSGSDDVEGRGSIVADNKGEADRVVSTASP